MEAEGQSMTASCPQCEVVILGATPEDWREHFREDCNPLGALYTFASPMEDNRE